MLQPQKLRLTLIYFSCCFVFSFFPLKSPAIFTSEIGGHTILRVNASHTHHNIFFTCTPPQRVGLELALRILLSIFCCLWVENSFWLPIIFRDNENLSKILFSLRLSCPWPWHVLLWKESEAVVVWLEKGSHSSDGGISSSPNSKHTSIMWECPNCKYNCGFSSLLLAPHQCGSTNINSCLWMVTTLEELTSKQNDGKNQL